jgi:hypothetical protein
LNNKPIVENLDYDSEIDGKHCYLRKITLPKKLVEGERWIEFKGDPLSFECHYIDGITLEDPTKVAHITFDFGMGTEIHLLPQNNFILTHAEAEGLSDEEKMAFDVIFDLFHAFHHTNVDPNYSHYHWALYGNLKDRIEIGDDYD